MKPGKYILFLLFFFTSLSINAQESPCDQFLSLFEAGEYEEVTTLLEECRNNINLDQDQKNEFDFYLNISYGFLNDYNRFDVVKMERLIQKNDFKNIKHIVSAYFVLSHYYAYNSIYDKVLELIDTTLFFAKQFISYESIDYAMILTSFASIYGDSGNFEKAIEFESQVSNIMKSIYGENHINYAKSLSDLAFYHLSMTDYKASVKLEEESLIIKRQLLGEEHTSCALSLSNLAMSHYFLGDYQKSVEFGEKALRIEKKLLGENHPSYATSLDNLSNIYLKLGDYSKALDLGQQGLLINKTLFGEDHPEYAKSINSLALIHSFLGDYKLAIELGEESLCIIKEVHGKNHPRYATLLDNLSGYYSELGDYPKALELEKQVFSIISELFDESHPDYAISLANLASCYADLGDYSKALELEKQALSISKEHFGENHPDYALSLGNIASYLSSLGDYQKAKDLVEQALAIEKQIYGENHPEYATSIGNLAGYYSDLGNYSKAIELGEQALSIRKEIYGENHPHYVLSLENLAFYYFYSKDFFQSALYLKEVFHKKKDQIQIQFNWLTENERLSYWRKQSWWFLNLPFMAYNSIEFRDFINFSYDGALLSKALMLNSSIELSKLLMESGDEEVIEKAEELRTIQYTLNRFYEKPISERFLDTDSLETVAQDLERYLLTLSKEYGDYTQFMSVTWHDVQKGLEKKDVAIEFVEFPVFQSDSAMYAALVLRKDWEGPQMIPLFEKREIEQYLTQTPDKQYSGFVGKQLYKLMWKPLEEVIQKGDAVHFSAAGVYHQLALEYLPTEDGTPLCDIYSFRRLSSTRQLAIKEKNTTFESATLYGGVQYDVNPKDMLAESKKYQEKETLYAYRSMAVDSLRGGNWGPLDNTVKEVEFISSELANNQIKAALFTGTNANEESIKTLSGKKTNILHLATHGFFLPIEETRKVKYYQMIGTDDNPTPDMSMRRSGLIMAGGNRAWIGDTIPEGIDDGILTAQEISVLDFREMDLVVLSACETGLGDIDTSEGVFGFQRAFKKAGAKTLIMSLWKVNDEVTKSLMNKFYQSLLSGKTKHEAFLEAQQLIRSRHPEPQNWAAFIMLD